MAILFKEEIDKKRESQDNHAVIVHNGLVNRANYLREKLLAIASECQDVYDTYKYMIKKGIIAQNDYFYDNFTHQSMAFRQYCYNGQVICQGLDFALTLDFQHLTFREDGRFFFYVTHFEVNGRQELRNVKLMDFDLCDDYYIRMCNELMELFLDAFPKFKEEIIKKIKS